MSPASSIARSAGYFQTMESHSIRDAAVRRGQREEVVPPEAFLASLPPPLAEIAQRLRRIVHETLPDVEERVRPGWGLIGYDLVTGRRSVYFAWIWPEPADLHVHLGFVHGVLMDDPEGVLQGQGTTVNARWLTYQPGDRIDDRRVPVLLREAERHALLPGGVRRAALLERRVSTRS
jgi:hypothetical protein